MMGISCNRSKINMVMIMISSHLRWYMKEQCKRSRRHRQLPPQRLRCSIRRCWLYPMIIRSVVLLPLVLTMLEKKDRDGFLLKKVQRPFTVASPQTETTAMTVFLLQCTTTTKMIDQTKIL